jgi:hypothetical protein
MAYLSTVSSARELYNRACYTRLLLADYYTCLGVILSVIYLETIDKTTDYYLKCARHECSCSAREVPDPQYSDFKGYDEFILARRLNISAVMTSNISINGTLWELPAPPLMIGLASFTTGIYSRSIDSTTNTSMNCWKGAEVQGVEQPTFLFSDSSEAPNTAYWNNGTMFDEDTIKRTGRCISEDAYSWGFSSLLLLTFCCFTIVFALTLILLQTDVYWNSRHDRSHQTHSVYTDVLYLAEELKASFGGNIKDNARSPVAFGKEVERQKLGLRLEVDGLPLSRWHERSLTKAANAAMRKGRAALEHADDLAHELRSLRSGNGEPLAAPATEYKALTSTVRSESQLGASGSTG